MGMICIFCCSLISFFLNFCIVRRLRVCLCLYHNSKVVLTKEKPLPDHLRKELKCYGIFVLFTCFCYFIPYYTVQGIVQIFIITLLIWIGILFVKKLTDSETLYLSSVNDLTLGFGAAMWYYKNYLYRILGENFLKNVRQYEKDENVELPKKLFILCPKSCKVKQYIDSTDCIEFSKDLPPYKVDIGGIKDREYSVSVYRIKNNGEFFRCALEYAQPLKTLLKLKENGKISLSEMYIERESFINNLTLMLRDHKNSFEVCELVEYDDEKEKLHEIFSGLPSVQPVKCKTEE